MRYLFFAAVSGIIAMIWMIALESVRRKNQYALSYLFGMLMLLFLLAAIGFSIMFAAVISEKIEW